MITLTNVKHTNNIGVCSFEELASGEPVVLALGMFDGVHAGHRRLFLKATELAEKYNAVPTVLTFVNHPCEIIDPTHIPSLLNTTREKAMLAADCGIKQMAMLWFDEDFATLSPDDFIDRYILQLNIKGIVCGYNYRFGRKASGDGKYLKKKLENTGVEVYIEDSFIIDDIAVSSTYIRSLIEQGQIERANRFLESEYIIGGNVVHGYERGRTLGFPTANLIPVREKLLPSSGVYATKTVIDSEEYVSVTNVGTNPTYSNGAGSVETFIMGFEGDLYDKYIVVKFYGKLRDEIKFSSPEELAARIRLDKENAVKFFERAK